MENSIGMLRRDSFYLCCALEAVALAVAVATDDFHFDVSNIHLKA